jgi:hypothetical protein
LIGTAFAFGGNPEKDALYLNVTPNKNDGATLHRLTVKDVPVDAFWPISVYNAEPLSEGRVRRLLFGAVVRSLLKRSGTCFESHAAASASRIRRLSNKAICG